MKNSYSYAHRLAFSHVCAYIQLTSLALEFTKNIKCKKKKKFVLPLMCMKMLTAQFSFLKQ